MSDIKSKKRVSFNQYSTYLKCPQKWFLDYVKNLRIRDGSINTAFGTAMHHAIQTFLELLYTKSVIAADSLDVHGLFKSKFASELEELKKSGVEVSEEESTDFYFDGEDIIEAFLKSSNRLKYFPADKYELVGIELPLEIAIKNNVDFVGFVDIILKEKTKPVYKIIDFKTSALGWNKYTKADESKYAQLHLYKAVYSKKFNVPLSSIDIEFFILKRKFYENVNFPQNRIQIFTPPHNKTIINESLGSFIGFLDSAFNPDGTYKTDGFFPRNPGNAAKKNCKYCKHKKINCSAKSDL